MERFFCVFSSSESRSTQNDHSFGFKRLQIWSNELKNTSKIKKSTLLPSPMLPPWPSNKNPRNWSFSFRNQEVFENSNLKPGVLSMNPVSPLWWKIVERLAKNNGPWFFLVEIPNCLIQCQFQMIRMLSFLQKKVEVFVVTRMM